MGAESHGSGAQGDGPERTGEYQEGAGGQGGQHAQMEEAAQTGGTFKGAASANAGEPKQGEAQQPAGPPVKGVGGAAPIARQGPKGPGDNPKPAESDMGRIMRELGEIQAWGNSVADMVQKMGATIEAQSVALKEQGGALDALRHQVGALQNRLDSAPAGGIDPAAFRALADDVAELKQHPAGVMDGMAQKAQLDRKMMQASNAAKASGERMLYHATLPAKVVRSSAEAQAAEAQGYRGSTLEAAGGDAVKALEIHNRAAAGR